MQISYKNNLCNFHNHYKKHIYKQKSTVSVRPKEHTQVHLKNRFLIPSEKFKTSIPLITF